MAHTLRQAIALCGINDINVVGGQTRAQRISSEVFGDDFEACKDKSEDELKEDLKTYSQLTVANGQIRLNPGVRRNLRALMFWCKDQDRRGIDPSSLVFPVATSAVLLRNQQLHMKFVSKSKTMIKTSEPGKFTADTKWDDWRPVFLNFLKHIPGHNGIPLSYVVRDNEVPDLTTPRNNVIEEYIYQSPLVGDVFEIDASEVHTYLIKLIEGNATAESKIQTYLDEQNGRKDFLTLVEYFEGVGVHSVDILKAERILESLFYQGEKKPHMWWAQFEIEMNFAFATYKKKEN